MGVFGRTSKQLQKKRNVGPKRAYAKMLKSAKNHASRPISALTQGYRVLNTYRFMRETIPQTATFTLIAAANYGAMGYMSFENLQFNQLPGFQDFNLFARYKVDMIITELVPMIQEVVSDTTTGIATSPQLEITKVNTKYMNSDFPIAATSDAQLAELAQLQAKTKCLYASRKPIKIITKNPGINARSVVDSAGNEVDARKASPWLSLSGPNASVNVPFKHNAIIFAARTDGQSLTLDWKYRVTHKIYFRCSQVG